VCISTAMYYLLHNERRLHHCKFSGTDEKVMYSCLLYAIVVFRGRNRRAYTRVGTDHPSEFVYSLYDTHDIVFRVRKAILCDERRASSEEISLTTTTVFPFTAFEMVHVLLGSLDKTSIKAFKQVIQK
jgi:hypothetical protein